MKRMFLWVVIGVVTAIAASCNDCSAAENASSPRAPFDDQVNKLALLIGINDYQAVPKLTACINDASRMEDLLATHFGFPEGNILMLTDRAAKREAILDAFRQHLIGRCKNDTVVVFYYSGHGSRMKDPANLTASGLVSTIVPVDSRTEGVFDISADDLRELFEELTKKTKNVTFVLDSCHSGVLLKGSARAKSVDDDPRDPPPSFKRNAKGTEKILSRDYALISACRADEVAFEYAENGTACSALTCFLAAEFEGTGKVDATYRDVMDRVGARVTGVYQPQHPQLEGANVDNLLFHTKAVAANPFVRTRVRNRTLTLEAGTIHGLTVGSTFDVFPPGTKSFDDRSQVLAQVELSTVAVDVSTAPLTGGVRIPDGARAVERRHNFIEQRMSIYLENVDVQPVLKKIQEALRSGRPSDPNNEDSPPLEKVFSVAAQPNGARFMLPVERGDIYVASLDGKVASPPVSTDDARAVDRILEQLFQWAQWSRVLNLSNKNSDLNIDFRIAAVVPREKLATRAVTTLLDGDELEFKVFNGSGRDVYFAVLDLSDSGRIGVVYPPAGMQEALIAGREFAGRVPVSVPEGRASVRDNLKLLVTQAPVDFNLLRQDAIKDAVDKQVLEDPLWQSLERSMMSKEVGALKVKRDGWTTAIRVLEVVAKED